MSDKSMRLFEFCAGLLYSQALGLIGLCKQSQRSAAMVTITAQSMLAYCLIRYSKSFQLTDGRLEQWIEVWSKFWLSERKDMYVRCIKGVEIIFSPATAMASSISAQLLFDFFETSQERFKSNTFFYLFCVDTKATEIYVDPEAKKHY